jgi:uncharacterized membrane protein
MNSSQPQAELVTRKRAMDPFRRAVLRGLAILLPPLLTIVIFLWMGNTINSYLLEPLVNGARWVMVEKLADIRSSDAVPADEIVDGVAEIEGKKLDGKLIPGKVYDDVEDPRNLGKDPMPTNAKDIYERYVNQTWLQREIVIPSFLCVFLLLLYLFGKFLAAGVGRFFWNQMERLIDRVPLVRNVYGSVKQVTDFLFTEPDIKYTRVVAVEYPRKGMWTLAFATGEGMHDIRRAAGEPMLTVFVPTSPMPLTGFALTAKKSEVTEMNVTIDQAIQFIVSCGVVIPPPPSVGAAVEAGDMSSVDRPLALSASVGSDD